jgi:hypothetical protein
LGHDRRRVFLLIIALADGIYGIDDPDAPTIGKTAFGE